MADERGYRFENVWLDKSDRVREQIKTFWREQRALPENVDPDARAEQVLYIVRTDDGEIGGVSSVVRSYVQRLGNFFYLYRTFIAEPLRRGYVAKDLLLESRDFLQQFNARQTSEPCLGIFLEVEAETLKYGGVTVKRAIWEESRFVFVGQARNGAHLRVYYFPGALIEPPDRPSRTH